LADKAGLCCLQVVQIPGSVLCTGQQVESGNALGVFLSWLGILQAGLFPLTSESVLLRVKLSQAEAGKFRVS